MMEDSIDDEFLRALESEALLRNSSPVEDFEGLTPLEMDRLLQAPLEKDSSIKLNPNIPDSVLDTLPMLKLTEAFLRLLEREEKIKLTPKGALPKSVVVELYALRFILDEHIESELYKLSNEEKFQPLLVVHYSSVGAGLVRKTKGVLQLTKEGKQCLASNNRNQILRRMLISHTLRFNWASLDGYPESPLDRIGWGFSIILLLKYGNEPRFASFYARRFIIAFPVYTNDFPHDSPYYKQRSSENCYCLRTFHRFLVWWGFVKVTKPSPQSFEASEDTLEVLPALAVAFKRED